MLTKKPSPGQLVTPDFGTAMNRTFVMRHLVEGKQYKVASGFGSSSYYQESPDIFYIENDRCEATAHCRNPKQCGIWLLEQFSLVEMPDATEVMEPDPFFKKIESHDP